MESLYDGGSLEKHGEARLGLGFYIAGVHRTSKAHSEDPCHACPKHA